MERGRTEVAENATVIARDAVKEKIHESTVAVFEQSGWSSRMDYNCQSQKDLAFLSMASISYERSLLRKLRKLERKDLPFWRKQERKRIKQEKREARRVAALERKRARFSNRLKCGDGSFSKACDCGGNSVGTRAGCCNWHSGVAGCGLPN